jgi:hypothetical protein
MSLVIDGVDLSAMREGLCDLLDQIPELNVVLRYADSTDVGNVPGAEVWLLTVKRAPEEEQLGYNAYNAQWRINVTLAQAGARQQRDAQELFEILVMRFHNTIDPLELISLVPVITNCSYEGADFSQTPLSDGTLYAVFMCSTTFLARQPS